MGFQTYQFAAYDAVHQTKPRIYVEGLLWNKLKQI